MQPDMPVETALRVYRRYLKLEPSHTEEYIAYLKSKVNTLQCTHSQTQIVLTSIAPSVVVITDSRTHVVLSMHMNEHLLCLSWPTQALPLTHPDVSWYASGKLGRSCQEAGSCGG